MVKILAPSGISLGKLFLERRMDGEGEGKQKQIFMNLKFLLTSPLQDEAEKEG